MLMDKPVIEVPQNGLFHSYKAEVDTCGLLRWIPSGIINFRIEVGLATSTAQESYSSSSPSCLEVSEHDVKLQHPFLFLKW